uniref:Putative secreted protein n=1 Tax=Anopheles triannulatus TaxID=58253 RepID=A0A2M4B6U9_9DIPT
MMCLLLSQLLLLLLTGWNLARNVCRRRKQSGSNHFFRTTWGRGVERIRDSRHANRLTFQGSDYSIHYIRKRERDTTDDDRSQIDTHTPLRVAAARHEREMKSISERSIDATQSR